MPINATSVFHFTKTFDVLKGILEDNFHVKFSAERFDLAGNDYTLACPMVSFCDTPLTQLQRYQRYGSYGIGLTKDWAVRKGLSPVLYVNGASHLAESLKTSIDHFLATVDSDPGAYNRQEKASLDILRFMKNHKGTLRRKGQPDVPNYVFEIEREWRFVPGDSLDFPMAMLASDYKAMGGSASANKLVAKERLKFDPDDIRYLCVQSESEIHDLIAHIHSVKLKYTDKQVEILCSRILTEDQIRDDF